MKNLFESMVFYLIKSIISFINLIIITKTRRRLKNHTNLASSSKTNVPPIRNIVSTISILRIVRYVLIVFLLLAVDGCDSTHANNFVICEQRCTCIQSSNKFTANCTDLNIDHLPKCELLGGNDIRQGLERIQVFYLNRNHFEVLPDQIFVDACLNNLQKLYLQQVGLKRIDDKAFDRLVNIREISLSSNQLSEIPSKALESLVRLKSLDLSFNQIFEVTNSSFRYLVNLQKLWLNNNNISFIDTNSFIGLINLETLSLASNQLKILQPNILDHFRNIHSLYLEGNEWVCSCQMLPFKRRLLQSKSKISILDNPQCQSSSIVWRNLALDLFQCPPQIFKDALIDNDRTLSEGSTLRLKCAILHESFGEDSFDREYLSFTKINWYWNDRLLMNESQKASCDPNCGVSNSFGDNHYPNQQQQQPYQIFEYFEELNSTYKLKVSNLTLYSVMKFNEGNYRCSVVNHAGNDEMFFHVYIIPYFSNSEINTQNNNNNFENKINKQDSMVALSPSVSSYNKNIHDPSNENADHILFGLVLGILSGLFIVLVIFSVVVMFCFRRTGKIVHHHHHQPHELQSVNDTSTNTTVDDEKDQETNTETTEKLNSSQQEFNPLLIVNPVQKPPRLGIPDVSSIYSNPSWTMRRANHNFYLRNNNANRSRYASYAETEPLYSDYYTLFRHNRHVPMSPPPSSLSSSPRPPSVTNHLSNHRLLAGTTTTDNNTFISDTASEV